MMESLLNVLITPAYADAAPAAAGAQQSSMSFFIIFGIFFVFMYFMILRPQNKRAREQQNLLSSLAKGDEVITAGGVVGRISKIAEQFITVTVANNIEIVMQKSSVVNVLPKGTLKTIE